MSRGEIVAWQAGVDWGRAGLSRTTYAKASNMTLAGVLDADAGQAMWQMGRAMFGHWFLMGLDDYAANKRA